MGRGVGFRVGLDVGFIVVGLAVGFASSRWALGQLDKVIEGDFEGKILGLAVGVP